MIVNVNPYDTGYDENSNVMRFSALAKEVYTVTTAPTVAQRNALRPNQTKGPKNNQLDNAIPYRRKVTISTGGEHETNEAVVEVLEGQVSTGDVLRDC